MVQTAELEADGDINGYTDEVGGTVNLFAKTADGLSGTFVESPANPVGERYTARFADVVDPETDTGYSVSYRVFKSEEAGTQQLDVDVELRQGYVSDASLGTLIATWSHVDVQAAATVVTQNLTAIEADAITDHTDLWLSVIATIV